MKTYLLLTVLALAGISTVILAQGRSSDGDEFFKPVTRRPGTGPVYVPPVPREILLRQIETQKKRADSLSTFVASLEVKVLLAKSENQVHQTKVDRNLLDSLIRMNDVLRKSISYLNQRLVQVEIDNRTLAAKNALAQSELLASKVAPPAKQVDSPVTAARETLMPAAQYDQALALFRSRHYAESLAILEGMQSRQLDADLAVRTEYWKGENHFGRQEYKVAVASFETVISSGESTKRPDAMLMMARCFEQLHDAVNARLALERCVREYASDRAGQIARHKLESPEYRARLHAEPSGKKASV